ncbi:hypothetical protein DL93DRAFT_2091885 [Clavulina sp. PMI_390]|nr:hypothetical protein DL93DRAFT_2091885 [Clavulina sp. PMI_390]
MFSSLSLEEKRALHQSLIRLHNSRQTIFRIPPEVLSSILDFVAAFSDPPKKAILPDHTYPHLSLSFLSVKLSSLWLREAAFSTTGCWTNVTIWFSKEHSTSPTILDNHLQRSGSLLFEVTIVMYAGNTSTEDIQERLNILRPHFHRCRRVEIWSDGGGNAIRVSVVTKFIRDSSWNYPALRSVKLVDYTFNITRIVPFWNKSDSQIESVDIEYEEPSVPADLHFYVDNFQLPSGLRRLRILNGLPPDLVIDLIRCCPRLEHFEWSQAECGEELPLDIRPLELPCLKTFKLGTDALYIGFPQLVAPRCETICLDRLFPWCDNDWLLKATQEELPKFPSLKRLSLVHTDGYPTRFHNSLLQHPSLEELFILCANYDGEEGIIRDELQFFDGLLSASHTTSNLLPNLHTLWYVTELFHWTGKPPYICPEVAAGVADSIHGLLTCRPSLRIKIVPEGDKEAPRELLALLRQFEGRLSMVNHAAAEWVQ